MEEFSDTDSPPPAQLPGWSQPVVVPWSNHPTTERVLRLIRSYHTTLFIINEKTRTHVLPNPKYKITNTTQAKAGELRPSLHTKGIRERVPPVLPTCSV